MRYEIHITFSGEQYIEVMANTPAEAIEAAKEDFEMYTEDIGVTEYTVEDIKEVK